MSVVNRTQSLTAFAKALHEDGFISEEDMKRAQGASVKQHPIAAVSALELHDLKNNGRSDARL